MECSRPISPQPPLPYDIVLRLPDHDFTSCRHQMPGQDVPVCPLSKVDVNGELDKCISEVATTLSRASISGNSVVKSNALTCNHPFPLSVCLLLQVILFRKSGGGGGW